MNRDQDLQAAADALKSARQHALNVLVLCSGFVDVRAAEGDPRAQDLARLLVAAEDELTVTNIAATTVRNQYQ